MNMEIIDVTYRWNGILTKRTATRRIILHHAAALHCTPQQVHLWHLGNGWVGIGYHFFVDKSGRIYRGRPEDTVGAHAGNHNGDSIGICFEGSFDREVMNDAQREAGAALVAYLKEKYRISQVQRHSDVNATGCPGDNFPFNEIASGEAPVPSPNDATLTLPLLQQGSKRSAVRAAQSLLNGFGFNAGKVDGLFGSATARAVKRFQNGHGLAADGIIGRDTWHQLLGV